MFKYYDEIKDFRFLYYIDDLGIEHSYLLPNVFFITSDGVLYRVASNNDGSNLQKCFDMVEDIIYGRKTLMENGSSGYLTINDLLDKEIKKYYEISNSKFISKDDSKEYLNLNHSISSKSMNLAIENILGVISARIGIYKFFRNLINYANDSKTEYEELLKMTNNDFCDILVRCCGFNKIEIRSYNEITTSNIDYEDDLFEYIIRNWHVTFISPIDINKSTGHIEDKKDNIYVKRLMY